MDLPRTFAHSIYSPEFYRSLSERPLSYSFRYFFLLAGTFALVAAIFFGIAVFPQMYNWLKDFGPAVSNAYPEELRIDLRSGKASANIESPFFMELPPALAPDRARDTKHILVVDTVNDFSLGRFDGYDTLAWLMEDSIAFRDGENSVRIQSLRDVPDFTLDRNKVLTFVYQVEGVSRVGFPLLIIFGVLLLAIGFLFFLSLHLAILLFWGILIMLMASFWQKPIPYSKAYQVGLHASSLSVALSAASLFFPAYLQIRLLPTLLTLLIAWLNLKPQKASPPKMG